MSVRNLTIFAGAVAASFFMLFLVMALYFQKGLGYYAGLSDSASQLGLGLDRIALLLDSPSPQKGLAEEIKNTGSLFDAVLKDSTSARIPLYIDPALAVRFSKVSAEWKNASEALKDFHGGKEGGVKRRITDLSGEVLSLTPRIKEDTLSFAGWYTKAAVIFSMVSIGVIWYAALFMIYRFLAPVEGVTRKAAALNAKLGAKIETQTRVAAYRELKALADQYERLSGNLNESLARYRDLVNTIPEALIETDSQGKITFINESVKALTGYSEEDLIGRAHTDLVPAEAAMLAQEIFSAVMTGVTVKNRELPIVLKDGSARYFEFSSSPVRKAGSGEAAGCRSIGRDVDERRKMLDELKQAKKESEEASGKLKRTVEDLEEFALLAVRRELKMHEIRERFKKLMEERNG